MYIPQESPVHHSIFCIGNPVIWFGGLASLAFCVFRILKDRQLILSGRDAVLYTGPRTYDPRYMFLMIGLLAQYLPWVLVPRGTYIYHYFASLPFLMTAVSLCFDGWKPGARKAVLAAAVLFTAAAAVLFVLLFPYASGMNVSSEWLDIGSGILRIWY